MSRKVYLEVKVRLIVDMEDGVEVDEFMSDMDYNFKSQTEGVDVVDMEIVDHEVTNSK